jgi:hypothetical protein
MPTFRRVLAVALLALPLSAAATAPAHASGGAENTRSYTVDVTVTRDGGLHVREEIVYNFGGQPRHGLTREIPTTTDDGTGRMPVRNATASSPDGAPAEVRTQTSDLTTTIRVGDPDRTVTGVHTYVIGYDVAGAVTKTYDHDANTRPHLGWDAIGTGWRTPIGAATVRLHAPGRLGTVTCSAGPAGATESCGDRTGSGATASYGPRGLGKGEGMTIQADLPPDVAVHLVAKKPHDGGGPHGWNLVWTAIVSVLVGGVLLLMVIFRFSGGRTYRSGGFRGFGGGFGGGGGGGGGGGAGGGGGGGGGGSW